MRQLIEWPQRHPVLSGLLLLLLAGWVGVWHWLGPLPEQAPTDRPGGQQSGADAVALRPSPFVSEVTSNPVPPLPRSQAWKDAFARTHSLALRRLVHEAAISGRVQDIVAAHAAIRRCLALHVHAALEHGDDRVAPMSDAMRRRVNATREGCAEALALQRQSFRLLDDGGDAEGAALAIRASSVSAGLTPAERQRLQAYLAAQGSPELLEAVFGALGHSMGSQTFGWQTGQDMLVSDWLLSHAVRLQACRAQGNCAERAAEVQQCRIVGDCVDDFEQYAAQRLFGPVEQRVFKSPTSEVLAAGFRELEQLAIKAGRNPAELQVLREAMLQHCFDQACLQSRWAEAQALVARLIGLPPPLGHGAMRAAPASAPHP